LICLLIVYFILIILVTVVTLVPLLLAIAFYTLIERKVIASIQRRQGPNVVGFRGLLQPFADRLKLIIKELTLPYNVNRFLFFFAPLFIFSFSLLNWSLVLFNFRNVIVDSQFSLLILYLISSFGVYRLILARWASNSRYPFLRALRSTAQIISYEVSIRFIFIIIGLQSHSLNLFDIVVYQQITCWNFFTLFPLVIIFFISILAETNRTPFDLPEAEAELVAGYNLEYSSISFAIFFLGEYCNILLISFLFSLLFLGGWLGPFRLNFRSIWLFFKILLIAILFVIVRATLPRYRYDQLIDIGWKVFFPFCFRYLVIILVLQIF
jgi:NADH-quinone oxidoreductase subunit H